MRTTQPGARWRMALATAIAATTMLTGSAAPALAVVKIPTASSSRRGSASCCSASPCRTRRR